MDKLFIANDTLQRAICRAVEHIDPENVPEWLCVFVELIERSKDTENRLCAAMWRLKEKEKQPDLDPQERAAIHACLYGGHRALYEPSGETDEEPEREPEQCVEHQVTTAANASVAKAYVVELMELVRGKTCVASKGCSKKGMPVADAPPWWEHDGMVSYEKQDRITSASVPGKVDDKDYQELEPYTDDGN